MFLFGSKCSLCAQISKALQCLEEALTICEAQLYNFQGLLEATEVSNSKDNSCSAD